MATYNLVALDPAVKQLVETTLPFDNTTGQLTLPLSPVASTDAVSKAYVDSVAGDTVTWLTLEGKPTEFNPAPHTHAMADINGLDDALDGFINFTDVVTTSAGVSDAGRIVALNGVGLIDASMLQISSMTYLGTVDPTTEDAPGSPQPGDTYISTAAGTALPSWGLTKAVGNGDMLIWNGASWDAVGQDIDLSGYVLKTGDTMTGPLTIARNATALQFGPATSAAQMALHTPSDGSYIGMVPFLSAGTGIEAASRLAFATGLDGNSRGWYIGTQASASNKIATVGYAEGAYVKKTGDTMAGNLKVTNSGGTLTTTVGNNGIEFGRTDGSAYFDAAATTTTYPYVFRVGGASVASIGQPGVDLVASHSLVTRQKGDARYYMLDGTNADNGLWIKGPSPYLWFEETDQAAGEQLTTIGMSNGNLSVFTRNDDGSTKTQIASFTRDGELSASSAVVTRGTGDARYMRLSGGNSISGDLTTAGNVTASGQVIADEFGGKSGNGTIIYGGDSRSNSNAPGLSDLTGEKVYVVAENGLEIVSSVDNWGSKTTDRTLISYNSTGDSSFPAAVSMGGNLSVGGSATVSATLNINGTTNANGSLSVDGSFVAAGSAYFNNHVTIRNDSSPQVQFRNAANQQGGLIYTNAGYINLRAYQDFASSNYTNYTINYGGASASGHIMRMADTDARYVNLRGQGSNTSASISIDGRYNIYADNSSDVILRLYDAGSSNAIRHTFNNDGSAAFSGNLSIYNDLIYTRSGAAYISWETGNLNFRSQGTNVGRVDDDGGIGSSNSFVTRAVADARYLNANTGQNSIGSTIFGRIGADGPYGPGANVPGSDLSYQNVDNSYTGSLSGTWKTCGNSTSASSQDRSTCFRRIS